MDLKNNRDVSKRTIFRQEALVHLSSPEQLDRALKITAPRERIAVTAFVSFLVAIIVWSFVGEISYTVEAQGLLTRNQSQGQMTNVILSPADGRLVQILVSPGDLVQAGQSVATLSLADTGNVIEIKSLYTGRVNKIIANPDSSIQENRSVLSLTAIGADTGTLEGIVYVSFSDAQNVVPGLKVLISPSTIPKQEFGYLSGEIISIGQFPSVDSFARGVSPDKAVVEVRVRLDADGNTLTGYHWTLGNGPTTPLRSGTACTALVTIKQEHPISRVLRFLDPRDYS